MLSINTNLSSLIAQSSLKSSTSILNQAVERMTTGYKINHAKDNAANYSISTNMQTQIQSYDVAADNVAMGMDLVTTASDIISTMQSHANKLQSLCIQSRNGTYGEQSMQAINSEATAIMAEINRLYNTSEYNGISLFDRTEYTIAPHLPRAGESGFIDETTLSATGPPEAKAEYNGFIEDPKTYEASYVDGLTSVSAAIEAGTLVANGEYKVSDVNDLKALAEFVNDGNDTTNMTFIMSDDIDLKNEANWTPIGDYEANDENKTFKGIFDGNGHKIKNLTIDRPESDCQGLFGKAQASAVIKNLGLEEVNIRGCNYVGGIAGYSDNIFSNVYVTGNVIGKNLVGGVAGLKWRGLNSEIICCYANVDVKGSYYVGGLFGDLCEKGATLTLSNCYTEGNVEGQDKVGGVLGYVYTVEDGNIEITNCYSNSDLEATGDNVGGLIGDITNATISNCFATGNVNSTGDYIGGLIGYSKVDISNCYATGNVTSQKNQAGGLVGNCRGVIKNCYATGNVVSLNQAGGLVGVLSNNIINSYATGNVKANSSTAGCLVGQINSGNISNCYSFGDAESHCYAGGLIGIIYNNPGNVQITNSISYGSASVLDSSSFSGGLVAAIVVTDDAGVTYKDTVFSNCMSVEKDCALIGTTLDSSTGNFVRIDYDLSSMLAGIEILEPVDLVTHLQVGVSSNSSSQIDFDTTFQYDISALEGNLASDESYAMINDFLTMLSEKSTMLGAVENRLTSALESIEVNMENLTSSLSTIRDADIAEVSSTYIQQQILQQAAATLMSTANQSPSIALQLI